MSRSLITQPRLALAQPRVAVATSSLLTGLTDYWRLEEASGNRVGVNGTVLTPAGTALPGSGAGKLGNGATFGAANNTVLQLAAASAGAFQPGTGSFSVAAWTNFTALGADRAVFGKQNTGTSHFAWRLYYQNGGTRMAFFTFSSLNGSTFTTAGSTGIVAGQWQHSVGVVDASLQKMLFYLNGRLAQSVSMDATWISSGVANATDANLTIGNFHNSSSSANGTIDAPMYASRAWTPAEVALLWNNGNGLEYPFGRGQLTTSLLRSAA